MPLKSTYEITNHLSVSGNWELGRDHIVSHATEKDSSNFAIVLSGRNIKSHLIVLFN